MAQTEEVKLHFLDYWRVIRVRWVLILLAFFLVLITAAVVTYFQPREYQSSVFIEVKSMAENPRIFDSSDPSIPIHDPQLAPTVYQVIQRTGILYPVIEDLKLQDKWSKDGTRPTREQAYQLLRGKLDVDEVRNTDLLQISVYDTDPQEVRRHREQNRRRLSGQTRRGRKRNLESRGRDHERGSGQAAESGGRSGGRSRPHPRRRTHRRSESGR